jgi:aspartyl-tRNA(Asn)/glutamyl-tRNA(Gln) amidotransferase subunit C
MPKVTVETVGRVAKLAHLSLTPEERATFARQLDEILAYAESIGSLDTEPVPPMSHAGTAERLREDAPRGGIPQKQVLASAPDPADRLFRVPRVIGG